MAENLSFKYDSIGDILYINKCQPYIEQESEEIGDDIIARLNPETGEVENLELLFFSQRLKKQPEWKIPIIANLHLSDYELKNYQYAQKEQQ